MNICYRDGICYGVEVYPHGAVIFPNFPLNGNRYDLVVQVLKKHDSVVVEKAAGATFKSLGIIVGDDPYDYPENPVVSIFVYRPQMVE